MHVIIYAFHLNAFQSTTTSFHFAPTLVSQTPYLLSSTSFWTHTFILALYATLILLHFPVLSCLTSLSTPYSLSLFLHDLFLSLFSLLSLFSSRSSTSFVHSSQCKAVLYCSDQCSQTDWTRCPEDASHRHWCDKLAVCMSHTTQLADMPFTYTSGRGRQINHISKSKT